jgi:PD-(D/E)XK endonuclease
MSRRKGPAPGRNQRPAQALPGRLTPSQTTRPPQTPFERELTTKRRGEISELAFTLAAARRGFAIAKPFGDSERYDVILDPSHLDSSNPQARPRLVRVQVKSSTQMSNGLYRVNAHRRINGRAVPYTLAEIDFFAAYVIPEDSWFIFPLPHILGLTGLLLRPKQRRKPHHNDHYREAWHYLREPDGLEFA